MAISEFFVTSLNEILCMHVVWRMVKRVMATHKTCYSFVIVDRLLLYNAITFVPFRNVHNTQRDYLRWQQYSFVFLPVTSFHNNNYTYLPVLCYS